MKTPSRLLLECDRAAAIPQGLKLIPVLEADDGITVRELADTLSVGGIAAKSYITTAVHHGWLYQSESTRDNMPVYRRTARGNLITQRLTC
jgi:hypothetical protein